MQQSASSSFPGTSEKSVRRTSSASKEVRNINSLKWLYQFLYDSQALFSPTPGPREASLRASLQIKNLKPQHFVGRLCHNLCRIPARPVPPVLTLLLSSIFYLLVRPL